MIFTTLVFLQLSKTSSGLGLSGMYILAPRALFGASLPRIQTSTSPQDSQQLAEPCVCFTYVVVVAYTGLLRIRLAQACFVGGLLLVFSAAFGHIKFTSIIVNTAAAI